MTNDRLNEILDEQKIVRYRGLFLKTMKQAVNEALDEAARIATENMLPKTSKEIDNLKVK